MFSSLESCLPQIASDRPVILCIDEVVAGQTIGDKNEVVGEGEVKASDAFIPYSYYYCLAKASSALILLLYYYYITLFLLYYFIIIHYSAAKTSSAPILLLGTPLLY